MRSLSFIFGFFLLSACGADKLMGGAGGSGGSGGAGGAGGGGTGGTGGTGGAGGGPWSDFPNPPIIDSGAPANAGSLFGAGGAPSGGPCLFEPEPGTLFPQNWLRPRFRWSATSGQNLYELRLHADNEIHDLVVYTTATGWTMPADMWRNLALHIVDQPITMTIRGAVFAGGQLSSPPALGSQGPMTVASVAASGSIVYWTPNGQGAFASEFRGFRVGDETTRDVLAPSQTGSQCVGCHSSTPDGTYVAFTMTPYPIGGQVVGTIGLRTVDGMATEPPFLTASARALLGRQYQEQPVFSHMHYGPGDRVTLTMMTIGGRSEIVWTNLEASGQSQGSDWGVLARNGDPGQAVLPQFEHAGTQVVYASASSVTLSVMINDGDIYTVPYNNRQGGSAQKLSGASDPSYNEFYPVFSADDRLIVFDRVPVMQSSYNDAQSELFVVPAAGGTPVRLSANDPPACSGKHSPGVTNSWPKWSPEVRAAGGKIYYWLTFSSTRGEAGNPQLYVTAVTTDEQGIHSSPALYLWNQPSDQNNHTPAWDVFNIVE